MEWIAVEPREKTQGLELPSLSEGHQSPEKTIHNPKPPLLPLDNNEHHYCIYLSITSVLHFFKTEHEISLSEHRNCRMA